jgi:D-sedoheptulose 7-phosphate isomerase
MTNDPMTKSQTDAGVGETKSAGIEERITAQLRESAEVKLALLDAGTETIACMAEALIRAFRSGGKVLLFGNGGSAADAQHIAAELAGKFRMDRPALPALALTTNTSALTATANDYGYARVFARQVEALAWPRDVVISISTSGNSSNVLEGIKLAKDRGAKTIGFTGQNGQQLAEMVDLCLMVPSTDTPRIQEAHITVGHIICDLVEQALFGEGLKTSEERKG